MEVEEIDVELHEITSISPVCINRKKNYWILLRNVIKAIALFRHHEVKAPKIEDLLSEIKQIPTDQVYKKKSTQARESSEYTLAIQNVRMQEALFRNIEIGGPQGLNAIKELINDDPYKYMVLPSNPASLVNKKNRQNCSPLYEACKHGHLDIVKVLIEAGADYKILSSPGNEDESCLRVAIRWGHSNVVKELLKYDWPQKEIRNALKVATTANMKHMLKSKYNKKGCRCF